MRLSPRLTPFALPVIAVALALGGCGGGGSGQDTSKLLKDTFSAERPVKSGRLDLLVDVRAAGVGGLPSPLRIDLEGPFQSVKAGTTPKFDFDLTLKTKDGRISVGAISTGTRGWVTLGQRAYTLSSEQFRGMAPAASVASGQPGVSLSSLGVDPQRWLEDVQDEGVVDLAGAKVVKLSAGVDVPRLLEDLNTLLSRAGGTGIGGTAGLPKGISAARRAQLEDAVQDAKVTIWTGEKDHQLRRIALDLDVDTPAQRDGRIRFDLAIAGLNQSQPIGPPANPRPLSELTAALAVLGNQRAGVGAGGTATTPAAPATTTPESGAAGASSYDACITAAGSELAKVQQCAALLGR